MKEKQINIPPYVEYRFSNQCCFFKVPSHEQALQQIVALKKEVSELRAKLASQEEDYHKSEGEMHAEVRATDA